MAELFAFTGNCAFLHSYFLEVSDAYCICFVAIRQLPIEYSLFAYFLIENT